MNTTSRNTKVDNSIKLNKGPFKKFINRKNALNKKAIPTVRPKNMLDRVKK